MNDYDMTVRLGYKLVTGVDAAVGMIGEGLLHERLDENTVIIFTSDNGCNNGAHGFGNKFTVTVGSIRRLFWISPALENDLMQREAGTKPITVAPLPGPPINAPPWPDGKKRKSANQSQNEMTKP